jgi:hypothetical protein
MVVRITFGPKRQEVMGGHRKSQDEDEMDRECSTDCTDEKCVIQDFKERNHLGDLVVGERKILQ